MQIEITGTKGDLKITNDKSFVTKRHDLIEAALGEQGTWTTLPLPPFATLIPGTDLDVSVQDLAQLYAAFDSDQQTGATTVRTFAHAVELHRIIDAINASSHAEKTVSLVGEL